MSQPFFDYNTISHPNFAPLRELPSRAQYKPGDVLVLVGELFARGYANGIVDEATRAGLKIIRTTVGRRSDDGQLRELTPEELAPLPKPFINIPLEAGFDMEPASDGTTPVDQLKSVKMSEWDKVKLDWHKIESSRLSARARFQKNMRAVVAQLKSHIPKGANVIFVHTMAGGVPRAKVIMPVMNKIFKGIGDRHVSSEYFWKSELGKLAALNFFEVTADTFEFLIDETAALRDEVRAAGGSVRYLAYGYHGTEVLIDRTIQWQTYSPYVQGWAKIKLEDIAKAAWKKGVWATVYNCPEILTNSSSIFQGVEVSLYPFIAALQKIKSPRVEKVLNECQQLLKPEHTFNEIQKFTTEYLTSPVIRSHCKFEIWPQHNTNEQMEKMLNSSDHLVSMHKNEKQLMTAVLSEEVFKGTGHIMFNDSFKPQAPVLWLGHDILAKASAVI